MDGNRSLPLQLVFTDRRPLPPKELLEPLDERALKYDNGVVEEMVNPWAIMWRWGRHALTQW